MDWSRFFRGLGRLTFCTWRRSVVTVFLIFVLTPRLATFVFHRIGHLLVAVLVIVCILAIGRYAVTGSSKKSKKT